ncbi:MAG: dihydropteroate synthase [Deltaproteobacteria bacterium]|nr:dihydropteroate synthase [Deltaproteobacteria bacterium]
MSVPIHHLEVANLREARSYLEEVGVDEGGIRIMTPKMIHLKLKIKSRKAQAANILKQSMLSLGGDAAVSRQAAAMGEEATDVVLMGDLRHFQALWPKLRVQPFGLKKVGEEIRRLLENLQRRDFTLRCPRTILNCGARTLVVGVLNVTPDSFSDGGLFYGTARAVDHGLRMVEEGADILDVGGESTRPGTDPTSQEEELRRVLPVIEQLASRTSVPISIDTYKAEIASQAIAAGAQMINDISALRFDPEMGSTAARAGVPLILMHIQGTPRDMQKNPHYEDLMGEIIAYLHESIQAALQSGVDPEQIVVDPGIGFGKTMEHNLQIIRRLGELRCLGRPILLGTSRKSFIGRILDLDVNQRVEGTLASISAGILAGAGMVRVHDVAPARQAVDIIDAIRNGGPVLPA